VRIDFTTMRNVQSLTSILVPDLYKAFPGYERTVYIAGLSVFVLGFALVGILSTQSYFRLLIAGFCFQGPLLWAPMSEVWGRRKLFIISYTLFTCFNAGIIGSQNIWTVIILRFFSGAFGSSPLTNAGGTIS
jgi:MFS family permease